MSYIGGLYTGIKYYAGLVNNIEQVSQLDSYLAELTTKNKQDSVVSVFMMPYPFYSDGISPSFYRVEVTRPTQIGDYTPRNKKLLTAPFICLCVDTGNDSNNYYYESSDNVPPGQLSFIIACGMSTNPEIVVYPYDYNGVAGHNPSESVSCTGFPQCAFTIDTFRAWLAQSAVGDASSLIGSAAITAGSIATGNVVGGVLGITGLASGLFNTVKNATQGSKTRGNVGTSTDVAVREKAVLFKKMGIMSEQAKIIDSFFDLYGYSICRIKIPNRDVRPHWCYTKTQNVNLQGNVPADDMRKIEGIYDSGITFWKNFSEVGNYGLDNSVA